MTFLLKKEHSMKNLFALLLVLVLSTSGLAWERYNTYSLGNRYGAGSSYGRMSQYRQSYYSNSSWRNPYATNAPRLYYRGYQGRWSTNWYSDSNPYGYGGRYSGIYSPYGASSPYSRPVYVY
jgi:hypothetical protein